VLPSACAVLLDGGLKAPMKYPNQKTIIHGDTKETAIAMASVVAKVLRDRHMIRLHKKYPQYDFATHKGYGTKAHYRALKKYGLSIEHRKSFLH
ncbi:MAG: ribonuclease HII, partial [Patescibacteria group bacterium]